jgi:4-hydroxybenzoate polyprenyltransferase
MGGRPVTILAHIASLNVAAWTLAAIGVLTGMILGAYLTIDLIDRDKDRQ